MKQFIESHIIQCFGARHVSEPSVIQRLWSGYGSIARYALEGADVNSVIVKHIAPPPPSAKHPRGWNTARSHQRKLQSYRVESSWYRDYAQRCGVRCRVPKCYSIQSVGDELILILEDLDEAGFNRRRQQVSQAELQRCLSWLATFHATFLEVAPCGLWPRGTYWHLDTRPDELEVLKHEDRALYDAARTIDRRLATSTFQTLVHGDAKLANFCFAEDAPAVAAVDFQYCGRGCAMQDVAMLFSSCWGASDYERHEATALEDYFKAFGDALSRIHPTLDLAALEREWRALYPVACADFQRFLKGWSPGHWKVNAHSERLTRAVLAELKESKRCN
jgi:aminoglycoside phosphotransferase (APT) family kinase protein